MAYWVKKEKIFFVQFFSSLDKKTRIISRVIAFIALIIIILIIKSYIYKTSWDKGVESYRTTSHTWNDLNSILPYFFYESFIYAIVVFLFVHFLDYFTKDTKPPLICNNCFRIKNYENDLKCECGGKFERENDMERFVNEEEYKVLKLFSNRIERNFIRGTNYYRCLSELPSIIFCPGCLSEISLDKFQQIQRKYYCNKCRMDYDFNTPAEWIGNGKVKDEYKYDLGFILNGELNVSSEEQSQIKSKIKLLDEYRRLSDLPNNIKCPHCNKRIKLYRKEILDRKFECTNCHEFLDLTYNK